MAQRIANKAFYVLIVLAVLVGLSLVVFPHDLFTVPAASAAGDYEVIHGATGDYYRTYQIYEQVTNPEGDKPATFGVVKDQIGALLKEAVYQYGEGAASKASDLFRRARYYWYDTSEMSAAVLSYMDQATDDQVHALLDEANAIAEEGTESQEALQAKVDDINALLGTIAATLDAVPVAPKTYHKKAELDAAYYLSYAEYERACKAQGKEVISYTDVATQIGKLLEEGMRRFRAGESDYYDPFSRSYGYWYETSGFERKVMAYISGARVTAVELQFSNTKKAAQQGVSVEAIQTEVDKLNAMLLEDADKLDDLLGLKEGGKGSSGLAWATFAGCFTILFREGLEAILIIGAIIAYLVKSGNKAKTKAVYIGCALALVASAALAALLYSMKWTGIPQEIIEGITALIAVAVLIYVSNWMLSKSEADSWNKYIKGKVSSSVDNGKTFALGFTAFLAVFREGAEVILFYQPLVSSAKNIENGGWAIAGGILAGAVAIAAVFVVIRVFGVKLPLKPLFMGTSILMALMSIAFLGAGIQELFIDGGLYPVSMIPGLEKMAESEVLTSFGIYPTWLTIIPQLVLLAITIVTFVLHIVLTKRKKAREAKEPADEAGAQTTEAGEEATESPVAETTVATEPNVNDASHEDPQ